MNIFIKNIVSKVSASIYLTITIHLILQGSIMRISTQVQGKFGILKFEIDQVLGYEAQEFQDALLDCLEKDIKFIIVDLSKVKYISSWGIGMLIHGLATTRNRGSEFKVVCLADNVLRVFKSCKLDSVLDIYESIEILMSNS